MSPSTSPLHYLTDEEILAELKARVLRNLSEQATNASETEVAVARLPLKSRRAVSEEIKKLNPVPQDLDRLPEDHHKVDKETTANQSQPYKKRSKGESH